MTGLLSKMVISLLLVSLLAVSGGAQEMGDLQQLIGLAYGNQLNNMMSACCVIRDLQCPAGRYPPMMSRQNTSQTLDIGVRRYERCVCMVGRQCVLSLPPHFLPDGAHNITFDVTFVASTSTTRYACTYHSKRALICRLRHSMATGLFGLGLPGMGEGLGAMGPFGGLGVMGEEMEEVLEQMVESGIPPPRPRPSNQVCPRCVPLICALNVARYLLRMRSYRLVTDWNLTSQRQYHSCLSVNSIQPPQLPPAPPPKPLPVTPSIDTDNNLSTTTTTSNPTTMVRNPSTKRTTTTTSTTTSTTTPIPPTSGTTQRPLAVMTTPGLVITSITTVPVVVDNSTPTVNVVVNTTAPSSVVATTSATKPLTTSQVQEITRTLVGVTMRTTSLLPQQNVVGGAVTENGESSSGGGGGVLTGVLLGTLAAVAILTAFFIFLFFTRRRRQRKERQGLDGSGVAGPLGSKGKLGVHHKTVSLPSVSSKRAVIDSEEKADDEDVDENNDAADNGYKSRYTPLPSKASVTPSVTSQTADGDEIYASLDESAMIPTRQTTGAAPSRTSVAGSDVTSAGSKPRQDSKRYNARPTFSLDGNFEKPEVTGTRSNSSKYYNVGVVSAADGGAGGGGRVAEAQYEKPRPQGRPVHIYTALRPSADTSGERSLTSVDTNTDHSRGQSQTARQQNTVYTEPYTLPASLSRRSSRTDKGDPAVATESRSRRSSNSSSSSNTTSSSATNRRTDSAKGGKESERRTAKTKTTVSRQSSSNSRGRDDSPRVNPAVDPEGYLVPLPPRGPPRV